MKINNIEKDNISIERTFLEEKKISPHLICFLCQKVFNNPALIDCGHTFCYNCLIRKLKENGGYCPKCHAKNFSTKISRDLLAYNLVMELEVSCNNVGKCPWVGHLSELEAHQNLCDKTIKILEENKKQYVSNISKRFSYYRDKYRENEDNNCNLFCKSEIKKNRKVNMNKDSEIMINNLEKIKQKFENNTNKKEKEIINQEQIDELKKLFL